MLHIISDSRNAEQYYKRLIYIHKFILRDISFNKWPYYLLRFFFPLSFLTTAAFPVVLEKFTAF